MIAFAILKILNIFEIQAEEKTLSPLVCIHSWTVLSKVFLEALEV